LEVKSFTAKQAKDSLPSGRAEFGFSLLEVAIVLLMTIVIVAFALPNYVAIQKFMRISGDSRSIASLMEEAKLIAAANFTHARVRADLIANTYHLEVWNKSGGAGGTGCWQTNGDVANACTVAETSPVFYLSSGVSFSFGAISAAPANTQLTIGQAPICYTGAAGQAGNSTTIANTACIEFNSRGIPSDPTSGGKPDANGAFYLSDTSSVYGVTLLSSGEIQSWFASNNVSSTWQLR
jgi:Tfp pilus assembly protein FimT